MTMNNYTLIWLGSNLKGLPGFFQNAPVSVHKELEDFELGGAMEDDPLELGEPDISELELECDDNDVEFEDENGDIFAGEFAQAEAKGIPRVWYIYFEILL